MVIWLGSLFEHYNQWWAVLVFVALYGGFLLFLPYHGKMSQKPKWTYFAFVVAFAVEMHGIPYSMYLIGLVIGRYLPEGVLWGHTLQDYIGYTGLYLNILLGFVGFALILSGWRQVYHGYWKQVKGSGHLVKTGVYRYIRHPQYTGIMLVSLGMLLNWATLTTILMFPLVVYMYIRLAKREEQELIKEFNEEYIMYQASTKRFIPFIY